MATVKGSYVLLDTQRNGFTVQSDRKEFSPMRLARYLLPALTLTTLAVAPTAHADGKKTISQEECDNGCTTPPPPSPHIERPAQCEDNVSCSDTGEPPLPPAFRATVWCEQARGRVINPPSYGLCVWGGNSYIWVHGAQPWWIITWGS